MIVSLYIFIDDTWMCSPVDSINIYLSYTKAPFWVKKEEVKNCTITGKCYVERMRGRKQDLNSGQSVRTAS